MTIWSYKVGVLLEISSLFRYVDSIIPCFTVCCRYFIFIAPAAVFQLTGIWASSSPFCIATIRSNASVMCSLMAAIIRSS